MNFKKFKQLCIKAPKKEIMGDKKSLEYQNGTILIDMDSIIGMAYKIHAFPSDSNDEKEIDEYCEKNHITLVKLFTKYNTSFINVIEPFKGYFDVIFDLTV